MEHNASEIHLSPPSTMNQIVELESTMQAIDAAKLLWKNNIVGAPVWDKKTKKYIGFFEMRDILSSVIAATKMDKEGYDLNSVNMDRFNEHMVKELASTSDPHLTPSSGLEKVFADVYPPDHTISYLAVRNQFVSCQPGASLFDLCECLAKRQCHRVPILDNSGKCCDIITQTALIKFISENCPRNDLQESIKDAQIPYRKTVISTIDSATASEAFTLLDDHRLSGIAVIDEDGKLIGNTSARDIKLAAIDEGNIAMDMDILSYLAKVRQSVLKTKERYPSCHVHEDASIGHVIDLLARTGYHRVFVVDEDIRPIGVISVTDITIFATHDVE